ncbi:PilZ domain-containing protein [Qipengyuania nanhaisediminis]|uniref:PilZ domain-containing protein n=1 Tax=Qipengyuania nanhaisediminis TaxID=604088 RepID=UPI0038B2F55D
MSQAEADHGRAAPRLPLSLPAKFIAVAGRVDCIITNLSRTGVLIAVNDPIEIGAEGFLRSGPIDHFMIVARREGNHIGMTFEIPVSDAFVKGIKYYQDSFEDIEREQLANTARDWIGGVGSGL